MNNTKAPSNTKNRTRIDPFAEVFDSEVVPLLKKDVHGKLHARTILEELMEKHPEQFSWSHLRTLERRVKQWREEYALGPEAFIPQNHPPGLEAQIDFTSGTSLGVTISGEPYPHKIGEFILSHSGARYAQPAPGESFPATLHLIQAAVSEMGGSPRIIRSDGLPSCVQDGKPVQGYKDFLTHYNMRVSVINPYRPNENGVVEQSNFRINVAIAQALIVRGSLDFGSPEEYAELIKKVVRRYNRRPEIQEMLKAECPRLRPLPAEPAPIYARKESLVTKFSLIRVDGNRYSVPSKFIGKTVEVRMFDERLEVHYEDAPIATWDRVQGKGEIRVDYRHVIEWMVRKPGSFAHCEYREQLFPTRIFREAYAVLRRAPGIGGDAEYLRILQLAAKTEEAEVEAALELLLEGGGAFTAMDVWGIMAPPDGTMPSISGYQLDMDLPDTA